MVGQIQLQDLPGIGDVHAAAKAEAIEDDNIWFGHRVS